MSMFKIFRLKFRLYHKQAYEWEAVTRSLDLSLFQEFMIIGK